MPSAGRGLFSRLFNRNSAPGDAITAGSDSGSDSDGDSDAPLRAPAGPGIARRAGCDGHRHSNAATPFRRSKTSSELLSHAPRNSISSCYSLPGDSGVQQLYHLTTNRYNHRGRHAVILKGFDRETGAPVVLKAFSKLTLSAHMRDKMEREVAVLKMEALASCPGVVNVVKQVEDESFYYTVQEAAQGATLIQMISDRGGRLGEQLCVAAVVRPLLQTLDTLHAANVVHRSITPEHIVCDWLLSSGIRHRSAPPSTSTAEGLTRPYYLQPAIPQIPSATAQRISQHTRPQSQLQLDQLNDQQHNQLNPLNQHRPLSHTSSQAGIKLLDFCDSAIKGVHALSQQAGALEYMAPEVAEKPTADQVFHQVLQGGMCEAELPQYDEKVDVWSLGVVLLEALTGQQPFACEGPDDLRQRHQQLGREQQQTAHHQQRLRQLQAQEQAQARHRHAWEPAQQRHQPQGHGSHHHQQGHGSHHHQHHHHPQQQQTQQQEHQQRQWAPASALPPMLAALAEGLSDSALSFIAECLSVDPRLRPSAAELLHHPWMETAAPPPHAAVAAAAVMGMRPVAEVEASTWCV